MINPISQGQETLIITASTTLGYGGGMTAPPRFLLCNASSNINVVLPTIPSVLPNPPGTIGTSAGTGDGLLITIRNLTSNNVTVTAGGSDTLFDPALINGTGASVNLCAVASKGYWYNLVSQYGGAGYRAFGGTAVTATTSDRYLVSPTAATVTLAATTSYPIGSEVLTVINTSGGSDTITPASGTIAAYGASYTLATHTSAGLLTNGTDWFLTHTA